MLSLKLIPHSTSIPVHRARNLLIKGKSGKNNCYVTISVGKDKYMTTQQKDAGPDLEWHEQCELPIPEKGNRAELVLTCLHQNSFGLDDFLGQVTLPLNEMDVYEVPRPRWCKLQSKPGKEKQKDRGELEVRVGFTVKSGSMTDLSGKKDQKHKSSMASNIGGSLLSINTLEKRKGLKKFAKSLGSKMHITGKKKDKDKGGQDNDSMAGSTSNVWPTPDQQRRRQLGSSGQMVGEADPGVISEDDDEFAFENLSHKSSGSSLNVRGYSAHHNQRLDKRSPAVSVNSSAVDVPSKAAEELEREDQVLASDYANRSMTLPAKPQRTGAAASLAAPPRQDEWAEKLYGKTGSGSLGSSDSLKRRSWEPAPAVVARVPIDAVTAEEPFSSSTTAPSSPVVKPASIRASLPVTVSAAAATIPQPLPRHSMESIVESSKSGKKTAEKENKFTKKLKYLRDFGKSDAVSSSSPSSAAGQRVAIKPTLSGQFYNNQSERIIIGHENDVRQNTELPKEVLQRYEGKTREVSDG